MTRSIFLSLLTIVTIASGALTPGCNLGTPVPVACVTPDASVTEPDGATPDAGTPPALELGHVCAGSIDLYDVEHNAANLPPIAPNDVVPVVGIARDALDGSWAPSLDLFGGTFRGETLAPESSGTLASTAFLFDPDALDPDCVDVPTTTYGTDGTVVRDTDEPRTVIESVSFAGIYPWDGGQHRYRAFVSDTITCIPVAF